MGRKIYLVCPWHQTGGPEDIHQLCHAINTLGEYDFEGQIYYYQAGAGFPDLPPSGTLYTGPGYYDPTTIHRTETIDDTPGNVIVVPEVLSLENFSRFRHCQKVLWWLSLSFGQHLAARHIEGCRQGAWMAFHARHTWNTVVQPHEPWSERCVLLSDYIRDEFWNFPWLPETKRDVVVYNARKDAATPVVCARLGIPSIPLQGMSQNQVMAALASAKAYVDLGFHPGKDHLPREAAILGCIVITNRVGSAACHDDLPITQKCDSEMDVGLRIADAFTDYAASRIDQSAYLAMLREEKSVFFSQVRALFDRLSREE